MCRNRFVQEYWTFLFKNSVYREIFAPVELSLTAGEFKTVRNPMFQSIFSFKTLSGEFKTEQNCLEVKKCENNLVYSIETNFLTWIFITYHNIVWPIKSHSMLSLFFLLFVVFSAEVHTFLQKKYRWQTQKRIPVICFCFLRF